MICNLSVLLILCLFHLRIEFIQYWVLFRSIVNVCAHHHTIFTFVFLINSYFQKRQITSLVGYLANRILVKIWSFFLFFACLLLNRNLALGSRQTLCFCPQGCASAFDLEILCRNRENNIKWPRKLKPARKIILITYCLKVQLYTLKVS